VGASHSVGNADRCIFFELERTEPRGFVSTEGLGIKYLSWLPLLMSAPNNLAPLVNARGRAGFIPPISKVETAGGLIGAAGEISMGSHSDARETLWLGGELRETLEAKEISRSEEMSMSPFRNRLVMFLLRNGAEGAARN